MNSLWLAVSGLIVFAIGYRFYAKWLAEKIYRLDLIMLHQRICIRMEWILSDEKNDSFGHHFTSVAGAAPLVGPAIAVYWGWQNKSKPYTYGL